MKTKDDRKDFTTRKGFIFNLPDDYNLDESDGDLFGIIEIPFDVFTDDSNNDGKKENTMKGGNPEHCAASDNPYHNCKDALKCLIATSLGMGRGRPTGSQSGRRSRIKGEIRNRLNQIFGYDNIIVNLIVKGTNTKALLIEFKKNIDIPDFNSIHNFHLSVHYNFFSNPSTHNRSMAHTVADNHNRDRLIAAKKVLNLDCTNNNNTISFVLSLGGHNGTPTDIDANLNVTDEMPNIDTIQNTDPDTYLDIVNVVIPILNENLFNQYVSKNEVSRRWVVQESNHISQEEAYDINEFPSLGSHGGQAKHKYKKTKRKTKRKTKNLKKKSKKQKLKTKNA